MSGQSVLIMRNCSLRTFELGKYAIDALSSDGSSDFKKYQQLVRGKTDPCRNPFERE